MIVTKYIVPLYYNDEFNGTGFIVGNILITAAHVVISKENVCSFLYNGKKIRIGPDNNVVFDYPNDKRSECSIF